MVALLRHRRARVFLAFLALACLALGATLSRTAWELMTLEWVPLEEAYGTPRNGPPWREFGMECRGFVQVKRRGPYPAVHGRYITWYVETGFKCKEAQLRSGAGSAIKCTAWDPTGKVISQRKLDPEQGMIDNDSPPWWWGVSDQTSPTAPWFDGE